MSTNFYSANGGVHIGKRHAAGVGQTSWSWAIDPMHFTPLDLAAVQRHCPSCSCIEDDVVAYDEYDRHYTWSEILAVVNECADHSTELVGREFC
jgi:hypothetical protein